MRCFVALNLPQEVKDYLYEFQRKAKTKEAKINWVAKKNLHLTLKFFGNVNEEQIDKIKESLSQVKEKIINASLDGIGVFPDEEFIRVVWIGIKPEEKVIKLAHKIDEETLEHSAKEQRFTAHLTLGRIRNIKSKEAFLKHLKEMEVEKLTFKLDSFSLYKSTLTNTGPIYKELENYKLS